MRKLLAGIAAGMFVVGLAGCSGGGGSGGGGGGQAALQYTGNTNPAVISTSNAAVLTGTASNTESGADVAGAFGSVTPSQGPQTGDGSAADVPRRAARRVLAAAAKPTTNTSPTAVPVNETDPCPNGGSVSINGDLTPGGTGTVNVTFRNCVEGGDSLDGIATLRIDSVLLLPPPQQSLLTNFTVSFGRLSLRGSANADLGGFVQVQFDPGLQKETITENAVVLDLDSGVMMKAEITVVTSGNFPFTKTINGRVFHSTHGFVTIATNPSVPLTFASPTQPFPQSGELTLTGANGASILVQTISANGVRLSLDLNPVLAGFERVVTLAWTDLTRPAGSNLVDTDGDGMHDSWELAYGLDPNDRFDADKDKDLDGVSNLTEYLQGTKPNDLTSIPQVVSLLLQASAVPGQVVPTNSTLTYRLSVGNFSVLPANDVVLTDTLPPEVTFVSVQTFQGGSCSQAASTVTCNLKTVKAGTNSDVTIVVTTPNVPATLSNVATVTSSAFETNLLDNTVTTPTTVQ
jgi:uncharacterized repeat protein (TIGR01451 family)